MQKQFFLFLFFFFYYLFTFFVCWRDGTIFVCIFFFLYSIMSFEKTEINIIFFVLIFFHLLFRAFSFLIYFLCDLWPTSPICSGTLFFFYSFFMSPTNYLDLKITTSSVKQSRTREKDMELIGNHSQVVDKQNTY